MGERYGNVWIMQATPPPEGELEKIRKQILPEEILFNQMLEANHTTLIRSGLARKAEELGRGSAPVHEKTVFMVWRSDRKDLQEEPEPVDICRAPAGLRALRAGLR